MSHKIVVCGAGFLGKSIGRAIATSKFDRTRLVQISSRHPEKVYTELKDEVPPSRLLNPVPLDVTKPETLSAAFEGATAVISLVGLLTGTPSQFEKIQWKGAENVAKATKAAGAKLIHFSAIGADPQSDLQSLTGP